MSLDGHGNSLYLKMKVTENIKQAFVRKFAYAAFAEGSVIHSDGYRSYIPALEDFVHEHRPYNLNARLLHWLHITISNAKAFILGTYYGLSKDNLQSLLFPIQPPLL